jgi:serine protease inhibitor
MFDQNKTEEQDFYVSANEKFCVEMMYRPATKFNYGRSD